MKPIRTTCGREQKNWNSLKSMSTKPSWIRVEDTYLARLTRRYESIWSTRSSMTVDTRHDLSPADTLRTPQSIRCTLQWYHLEGSGSSPSLPSSTTWRSGQPTLETLISNPTLRRRSTSLQDLNSANVRDTPSSLYVHSTDYVPRDYVGMNVSPTYYVTKDSSSQKPRPTSG